jgi:nucleotide-binding universal stress UspA family protein
MKVILPFDGSPSAHRALDYIVNVAALSAKGGLTVDIVNVQEATVGISDAFMRDAVDVAERLLAHANETGGELLAAPIERLKKANLFRKSAVLLGEPADCIAEYADDNPCDFVIMGTRGLGPLTGAVLGSVAMKVIHLVKVPVTLVK